MEGLEPLQGLTRESIELSLHSPALSKEATG